MNVTIIRRALFCAGHRLYNPEYSDEKNSAIFGACANPNGHGHNYVLEVSISGPIDPETGMVINLRKVKQIIAEEIISKVDHKNLNTDVDFIHGLIPTTENLASKIFEVLDRRIEGNLLSKVALWESENNCVEVTR